MNDEELMTQRTKKTTPERLDLGSADIVDEKRAELLRLFPEVRTEGGKLDFDRLKLALGESVDVGKERYGMTWPGKADCFKTIQRPSLATLRPERAESINFDTSENLIIEGDNLEVLKLLQKSYLGKVKMIYIDPPYNTGNDFIYPDDFSESLQTYLQYTGQADAERKKFGTNTDTDGRYHSKWLNMMYPRLYLARNLLRDDGVLFVSIDESELDNLKKVCAEIFGEDNCEGIISWRRRHNQPNDKTKMIGKVSEFIVAWARNSAVLKQNGVGTIALTGTFANADNDPRGPWASKPWKVGTGQSGSRYVITGPKGDKFDEEWMGELATFEALRRDNRIVFPNGGRGTPRKKYFQREREAEGQSATNWWPHDGFGHNQEATDELAALLGGKQVFDNPKPVRLVRNLITVGDASRAGIILDFFAGSGTTAHAVLDQNSQDGGSRRFILVQLPERLDPNDRDQKVAAAFCDSIGRPHNIAEITKERVRRVIKKQVDENSGKLDLAGTQDRDRGFRAFRLDESNFKMWDADAPHDPEALKKQLELHVDHVRKGRTPDDLLAEILLKSGFALAVPVEKITVAGRSVHSVADGALLVCLDDKLTIELIRAMAERKPERVVCLDQGFAGADQLKANAVQIFKTKGVTSFKTI
jgi:adenine-specific DNA-methyltransferase